MLRYPDLALSLKVEDILKEDLWVFRHYNADLFALSKETVKFSAAASIFVHKGWGKVMLSLREVEVRAPAVVTIREGEILQTLECSDDLDVSFCVLSRRFIDGLFEMITDVSSLSLIRRCWVVTIPPKLVPAFEEFYGDLQELLIQPEAPRKFQAALHTVLAFYYRYGYQAFSTMTDSKMVAGVRVTESFLTLVQRHFKTERFLEFYADKLGITRKHLSRVVKEQTGISPVEWIERNVILEAKVLLKSSTMTIQQISDSLNFSSQSFFGKHFKRYTGYTPGEYRNL